LFSTSKVGVAAANPLKGRESDDRQDRVRHAERGAVEL
jgi:hypothetical protein